MMKRMMACLLAAVICLGGCAAMGETAYFSKDAESDWYQDVLKDAQMNPGNNLRLKKLMARAQAGETVTVAFIGGSITEGAGASQYKECYAYRVFQGFKARFGTGDGGNVHCVNAGVGGTASTFGFMRYQRDIVDRVNDDDMLPDLVIVEYAVNDYQEPTAHRCYESLVKTILSQPNEPAVILLFSVFRNGFNLQGELKKIGETYDLPMVSIKDGAFGRVGKEWTAKEFFWDEYHPTSLGHAVMADCVLAAMDAANARETSPADIDLDAAPAYGTDYMGLVSVYGDSAHEEIHLDRGSFDEDDLNTYKNTPVGRVCGSNFFHNGKSGNEPLRFTATFKKLLIAWRAVSDSQYGAAEIRVDGKVKRTLSGGAGKWGQSEVVMIFDAREAMEHTVEIVMAEGSEDKKFTVTCISYAP